MSADSHTACPICDPEILKDAGIIHAEGYSTPVRENYESYWYVPKGADCFNGTPELVFEYRADCWDCGWHYETRLAGPLNLPAPPI